jgi:outer membrane protein insertion porin family
MKSNKTKIYIQFFLLYFCFKIFFISNVFAENLNEINVNGNIRISKENIITFLPVKINDEINEIQLNEILKSLYDTNFFSNVSVKFVGNKLIIDVIENPIIQKIIYKGIKSNPLLELVIKDNKLIERSSFIETLSEKDILKMLDNLKTRSYFFSKINLKVENLGENKVNLIYEINLGNKAKIKKISFIGDKVFKDTELKSLILSEEYRFWKIISNKKYLNEEMVLFDKRLLRNFFINNGYYNVIISSSFAKLLDNDEFELIFTIDAGNILYFGDLNINLPINYNEDDFIKLNKVLTTLKGKPYSINAIEKITNEINLIALNEQYETIVVDVVETFKSDNINLDFIINESEKQYISRINIKGNNITRENVIRNQFEIDEGDLFNEILYNKSLNNIKSLNFFKDVSGDIIENQTLNEKIINISVEEKSTGEIGASAGVGTSGSTVGFFVKENNYLGKGIGLEGNLSLSEDTVKGLFSISNPNYNDSDKSVYAQIEASEINKLKDFGYKTNRTGFALGTNFEILDDLRFGIGNKNYYERIEVDSTASALQKKQKGNYFDTFLNFDFDYDKRNQKFKPSNGSRGFYGLDLPIISDTNTFINTFQYTLYKELYKDNITSFSYYIKTSNSLSGDNIKLSERNLLPSNKLKGFVPSKIGPKDGNDYIGGNYASSINIKSNLPQIFKESENIDFSLFLDVANVWKVDYDSTIDDSSKIRSSIGFGAEWFTVVGPLNFSVALPLTKNNTDKTETFRFNLGTTF